MPHLIWKGKRNDFNLTQIINKDSFQKAKNNIALTFEKYDTDLKETINKKVWYNLLFCGENKSIMKYLLRDFVKKINLIYIDPPFATGGNFTYKISIGPKNYTESAKAYSDTWSKGLESYLTFLYKRLILMKALLSENGSIYIHLDWHVSHYVKIILDEIFGNENFRNEIIWSYPAASVQTRRFFIRSYDVLLFYTKSNEYVFNDDPNIYMEYSNRVKNALKKDEQGTFYYRGGSHNGKKLSRKVYVKERGIFPRDLWNDIPYIRANTLEYQGFSTQKPERLLKRIILASSNENDLVADFFCGTGTTLVVAEKLKRRWIGCDLAFPAVHITRKRTLDVFNSNNPFNWKEIYKLPNQPFKVINLNQNYKHLNIPTNLLKKNSNSNKTEIPNFDVKINQNGKKVQVELINYKLPYSLNDEITKQLISFIDIIDYWAVDFDHSGDCFNSIWYAYKTPKKRILELVSNRYTYEEAKQYLIQIKVINIFGQESIQSYHINVK